MLQNSGSLDKPPGSCSGRMRGAEKFDTLKGFKFLTHAHWWIQQAVWKSLSDQSRTSCLPEVIADLDAETAEDFLIKQLIKQDLEKVLDSFNPREKRVIRWRLGLEGKMKMLQEMGELMGICRERIQQAEPCSFRKVQNKKRTMN